MANNFSGDANCKALYRFENGALTTDSKGTNTLVTAGSPAADTVNFQEGAASVDLESTENDALGISDVNLNAGFPGKSGDVNKKLSICAWFRLESAPGAGAPDYNFRTICGKMVANKYSYSLTASNVSGTLYARFRLGYNGGASVEEIDHTGRVLSTGVWYHLTVTYQDSDKSYQMFLYDTSNTTKYTQTGNTTNNINIEDANFEIGRAEQISVGEWDGLIDELLVFSDIITSVEDDQITAGTYGAAGGASGAQVIIIQ